MSSAPGRSAPPRAERSTDFDWRRREAEWFTDAGLELDVSLLKRYVASTPVPVERLADRALRRWLHAGPHGDTRGPHGALLRPDRLEEADPSLPLLLVELGGGRRWLADGHHRLERGRELGWTDWPAVVVRDRVVVRAAMAERSSPLYLWWLWSVRERLFALLPHRRTS